MRQDLGSEPAHVDTLHTLHVADDGVVRDWIGSRGTPGPFLNGAEFELQMLYVVAQLGGMFKVGLQLEHELRIVVSPS